MTESLYDFCLRITSSLSSVHFIIVVRIGPIHRVLYTSLQVQSTYHVVTLLYKLIKPCTHRYSLGLNLDTGFPPRFSSSASLFAEALLAARPVAIQPGITPSDNSSVP